jgi:prepilin-type N-terminal cleavage/methylation domain-containing protein
VNRHAANTMRDGITKPVGLRRQRRSSRGFTLLEVLLVLALLVAIAALAAPALIRPLDNHRLRRAADQVRIDWSRARNRAMDSGRTLIFRYQPSGNTYVVEPLNSDEDYLEASDPTQAAGLAPTTPTAGGISAMNVTQVPTETKELYENVIFVSSESTTDMRAMTLVGDPSLMTGDEQWSEPIFFYPDGTTSTSRLLLSNNRSLFAIVSLRGLTGMTKVSDLLSAEELP